MRKILTLFFMGAFSVLSHAQSVTLATTQPACNNDGIITANFAGLVPPMTVTWSMVGQPPIVHTGVMGSSDVITNYSGAEMYVMVTDAMSNFASDYISQPPFTYTVTTTGAVCPALGSLTASVTGGLSPYTYVWYDDNTLTTVGTTNPLSVPAGPYGVTITDANGCVFGSAYMQDSIVVEDLPSFYVTVGSTAANCTNGTATISGFVGSGVPPYTYLWNNGATTNAISGLVMGGYSVEVTDAIGCQSTGYAYIQQAVSIGTNIVSSPATCTQNDGAAIAFGSGGLPPYSYLWSTSATTPSITGLTGGNYYTLTVTDANGCIGNGDAYIVASTPITVTVATTPSSCTSPTGSATLTIANGTAPYTTVWSTFPVQTGVTASGLTAGMYHFTVTDAVGCVRTGTVTVAPVAVVTGSFASTTPSCIASNGALAVTASGGSGPYTYLWSNGGTTTNISSIPAGSYSVAITDANGCVGHPYTYLPSSTPINLGLSTTPATCIFNNDGTLTAAATGGTAPYTYTWNSGTFPGTLSTLATGNYNINVSDVNGCTQHTYAHIGYNSGNNSCYCTVQGTVYNDANNNCTQDLGEDGIQNIQMYLSGIGYSYTDSYGHYSFIVPTGSYTLSETVQSFYPLSSCQNNSIAVNTTSSPGCTVIHDFGNVINPIHSMHVSSWHYGSPVPGNNYYLNTIITNEGTVPEANLVAGFKDDGQLLSPVFLPAGIYTGGVGNYYDVTAGTLSLNPAVSQNVVKQYNVPTNIPINTGLVYKDSVSYIAPMSNWLNDYSPWNNVSYYQPMVVASFDPNFKEVSPKGTGVAGTITPQDTVLEYMVHFQNLGTYMAQNIVVLDTLDADLDWSTLHPIYSSHDSKVTISDGGVLKYEFKNINLPAKMDDELLSNGMFTYSIHTKQDLAQGTQFTNSAAIYFDFNAPVITNTTLNTLGWTLDVKDAVASATANSFSVYPNPASNTFYAVIGSDVAATAGINVTDVSGKVIMNKVLTVQKGSQAIPVDAGSLAAGMYFVTFTSHGKVQTQKLVIMK